MLLLLAGAGAITIGLIALVPGRLGAFAAGAFMATSMCLLGGLVVQATGTAPTLAGRDAEIMTADALRRLRKRGWLTRDHIPFRDGDIDHIIVGPHRAVAIETKWTATPWSVDEDDHRIENACKQALGRARKLRLLLHSVDIGLDVPVEAAVVLWGPIGDGLCEKAAAIYGVPVVDGRKLEPWLLTLGTADGLDDDGFARTRTALDEWLKKGDDALLAAAGRRPWYVRTGIVDPLRQLGLLAIWVPLGTLLTLLPLTEARLPFAMRVTWVMVAMVVGAEAVRRDVCRLGALGWTAGAALTASLMAGLATMSILS